MCSSFARIVFGAQILLKSFFCSSSARIFSSSQVATAEVMQLPSAFDEAGEVHQTAPANEAIDKLRNWRSANERAGCMHTFSRGGGDRRGGGVCMHERGGGRGEGGGRGREDWNFSNQPSAVSIVAK